MRYDRTFTSDGIEFGLEPSNHVLKGEPAVNSDAFSHSENTQMPLLRFIDPDGEERDVEDVNHLYEQIKSGMLSYESLVRDDKAGRWVRARDHELFIKIASSLIGLTRLPIHPRQTNKRAIAPQNPIGSNCRQ